MKSFQIIILAVLSTILFSCSAPAPTETAAESNSSTSRLVQLSPEQQERAHITIGKADSMALFYETSCFGRTQLPPANTISIHFKNEAYIQDIFVLEGEQVSKNQLLATVEHPSIIALQQEFLVAHNQHDYLQKEIERKTPLLESKAVSQKDFNALQSDLNQATITLNALTSQLQLLGIQPQMVFEKGIQNSCSIYAPENGIIESISGNKGALIQPNQAIFQLLNTNKLMVSLSVFSSDLHHVSIGDSVVLSSQNEQFTGKVHSVSKHLVPENGSGTVLVTFNQQALTQNLAVGEALNATIFSWPQVGLTLPISAVLKQGETYVAYTSTNSGFEPTPLKVTRLSKSHVQFEPNANTNSTTQFALTGVYYLAGTEPNEAE